MVGDRPNGAVALYAQFQKGIASSIGQYSRKCESERNGQAAELIITLRQDGLMCGPAAFHSSFSLVKVCKPE
jgi:hypothetical protein